MKARPPNFKSKGYEMIQIWPQRKKNKEEEVFNSNGQAHSGCVSSFMPNVYIYMTNLGYNTNLGRVFKFHENGFPLKCTRGVQQNMHVKLIDGVIIRSSVNWTSCLTPLMMISLDEIQKCPILLVVNLPS